MGFLGGLWRFLFLYDVPMKIDKIPVVRCAALRDVPTLPMYP